MDGAPLGTLFACALTLGFVALIGGGTIVTNSFPPMFTLDFAGCAPPGVDFSHGFLNGIGSVFNSVISSGFGIGTVGCVLFNLLKVVGDVFLFIGGLVLYLWNLATLDIPGVPDVVRYGFGVLTGVPILWSVAMLVRGN